MNITYNNCKYLIYSQKSNGWRDTRNNRYYYFHFSCMFCGKSFLGAKKSKYCSRECKHRYEIGEDSSCYGRVGINHPMYGKSHSKETIQKISGHIPWNKGREWSDEVKQKISISNKGRLKGKDNPNFGKKGPRYKTYKDVLPNYGILCREKTGGLLEVSCVYCGKWFEPKKQDLLRRLQSIKGQSKGDNHLYCSEVCKRSCPIYGQKLYPKDHKPATSREVQPQLRKLVFQRDGWTCQKCGATDKSLHCHHIDPVKSNPIESADVDNCITLCAECHKEAHKQNGCKYNDLSKCV